MKKFVVVVSCVLLLSGCSQWESVKKKVPFLKEKQIEEVTQEDKNEGDNPSEEHSVEDETNDHKPFNDQNPSQSPDTNTNTGTDTNTNTDTDAISGPTLEAAYFNEVKDVAGKKIIQNPANLLALVNKQVGLPDTYNPPDLLRPKVAFSFGDQRLEKSLVRKEAGIALEKMFIDAKKSGIELIAVSGYRSFSRQKVLFDAEIKKVGQEKAIQAVAVPGQSEHQTGLAMDIASKSSNLQLTEAFGQTAEGKWLAQNAHRFGFILRYPKGKETITGYQYEPWHFRYVGLSAAEIIFEKKWTLEEYFNEVEKI